MIRHEAGPDDYKLPTWLPPYPQKINVDTKISRIPMELTEVGQAKIEALAADVAKILTTGLLAILEEDQQIFDDLRSDEADERLRGYLASKRTVDLSDVLVPTYYREKRIEEMPRSLTREANTPTWDSHGDGTGYRLGG
jgi:hypothetical protein